MSVILRHKKFPLIIIYKDPEQCWNEIVKDQILEELDEDGFNKFTVLDQEKAKLFLGFEPTIKKTKTRNRL